MKLQEQVREFHERFGHPVRTTPLVPSEAEVHFRLRLVAEEFVELLDASLHTTKVDRDDVRITLASVIERCPIRVDLPEFADALADLAYVVEGTNLVAGIDSSAVLAEVHRSNVAKEPNGPDGKPVKGPTWTPPDIEGVLRRQGWKP